MSDDEKRAEMGAPPVVILNDEKGEELLPCPLCGNAEPYCDDGGFVWCSKESTDCPLSRWPSDFPQWNTRPIESSLRSQLAAAEREIKVRKSVMDRMPLCSDHRDKQTECPACLLETAERELDEANEAIRIAYQLGDSAHSVLDAPGKDIPWNDLPAVRRALAAEQRGEGEE